MSCRFFQFELKVKKHLLVIGHYRIDLCDKKPKPDMLLVLMAYLGIPPNCPWEKASVYCYNGKIGTFSASSKRLLGAFSGEASGVSLLVNITHDSGMSCFSLGATVSKREPKSEKFA